MSYFDEKLITELRRQIIAFDTPPINDHASIVRKVNENILFPGSKIAWNKLHKSIKLADNLPN
jgi:hypothetical protein